MFIHTTTIRLHDTDAAGVLYFANQFRLAHEAYEAFMELAGASLAAMLKKGTIALPIVHAESDYRIPLRVGDTLTISLRLHHLGKTSFTLVSKFTAKDQTAGYVTTTHVAINRRSGKKTPLPPALKRALQTIRSKK